MRKLTGQGEQAVVDLARRYGVSTDAVRTLLEAVLQGNGTRAQFSHPELGGSGQWMASGMTMIGDMFNNGLKATVSGLASELSNLLASMPVYMPAPPPPPPPAAGGQPGVVHPANLSTWWPGDLGQPSSVGGQNDSRYAVFPTARRLAVQSGGGPVRIHDTLDHLVSGVQQQQGATPGTLSFSSQHGTFTVDSLPLASTAPPASAAPRQYLAPVPGPVVGTPEPDPAAAATGGTDPEVILATIDRLSDLHQRGVLSDDEFSAKKAELLARL
ncbi:SHOCT domain-containing protein [Pseudofrankia sp. BMG5.37]|uniref:SHOCT domain-containing protein n=1 Tax=Pseudofrankia sp. BMG5.37 TaxID=3050035 RepID=UPI002893D948|nr:SHOCT domain-containing protein [Pseudofrankia sp. BMG5.37]MDT3441655.1 SHOCT domain-containing protein [Pseudofrankia sp. BMG5.37]